MKIFLESFSRLRVNTLMRDVRIFLVTRTFIILTTVCFPISKAHPAEVVFTIITLHVVASTILLYADMTFWTLQKDFTMHPFSRCMFALQAMRDTHIFGMSTNVIRRLGIIRAFCQPFLNCTAIGRCMVIHTTSEAEIMSVIVPDIKRSTYITCGRLPEYSFTR